jgi:hypothetical protein
MNHNMSLNISSSFCEPHPTLTASFAGELPDWNSHPFAHSPTGDATAWSDADWLDAESEVHVCMDNPVHGYPVARLAFALTTLSPSLDLIELEEIADDRPPPTHWGINE